MKIWEHDITTQDIRTIRKRESVLQLLSRHLPQTVQTIDTPPVRILDPEEGARMKAIQDAEMQRLDDETY